VFFELLVILYELYRLIDVVFELFNAHILMADECSLIFYLLLHLSLSGIELIDYRSKCIIVVVEFFKFLIHFIGFLFHSGYLFLSGPNVALEFFYLMIQDEFEFF